LAASLNPSRNNGDCPDRRTVCVFKLQREAGKAEARLRQPFQIRQVFNDEDVLFQENPVNGKIRGSSQGTGANPG